MMIQATAIGGAVYLFTISGSGNTWGSGVSKKYKIAHGTGVSLKNRDSFGSSVSLSADGTKLAVGAYWDDTGGISRGAVYLFTISGSGSTWGSGVSRKLKIAHGAGVSLNNHDSFGESVSLSADGTKLVVGAAGSGIGGAIYLFNLGGTKSITDQLNAGTDVQIVASNDITVTKELNTLTDTNSSGKLTLIAGRSILINQDVKIKGGLVLKANSDDYSDAGMTVSDRDTGDALITVATGKTISGGDKDLIIKMLDGDRSAAGNKKYSGRITVWKAEGKRVSIVHLGTMGSGSSANEIKILKGGRITATDDGNGVGHVVIELRAKRFVNESDAYAFRFKRLETHVYLGRLLVWTESPENNVMGGLQSYNFAQFNKSYNPSGGDFQSNTTKTSGTEKTSGFMYSTSLQVNYTASGASKTKIYNKTSTASTTNLALALKNADASSVATTKGITFKVGSLSGRADKKKHRDIKVTVDTSSATGQYRSSDGSTEQKNADSNLKIRYSGLKVTYRDANNRLVFGIDTKIDDVSGASISKKEVLLEGSDFTASTRVYNGTNDTSVTVTVASGNGGGIMDNKSFGLESGDQVQLDVTGAFKYADGNAGKKKQVYIADRDKIKFTGKDGGNYKLNNSLYKSGSGMPGSMKKGEITKKPLAIFAADFTVQTKTYDKTTDAKVTVASGNGKGIATTGNIGLVGDDKVTLDIQDGAFKFKNANAKNNEDVVFDDVSKITLTGADAKNYMLNPNYKTGSNTFGIVGTITKRELVLNKDEFQAVTRWYDGTTDATTKVTSRTKVVRLKTGGADGLKTATQAGGDKGVVSGDTVTFTIADDMFKFNSKDVASADKLLVTTKAKLNAGLGGKDAGNYEFKYSNNADSTIPAKITKKPLAIFASDFTVQNKTYDKTTDAKVTVASGNGKGFVTTGYIGLVSGEQVTLDIKDGAFKFKNANAKNNETIVFGDMSKITLTGADAKNYMLNPDYKTGFETYIVGTITKRELTLNKDDFETVTKVYDGTTDITTTIVRLKNNLDGLQTATEAGAGKGVVSGDTVTFTIAKDMFKFNSKDVATANKLLITTKAKLNAGLGGSSKANYEFKYANDTDSTISATITKKTLTVSATVASTRVYNKSKAVAVSTPTLSGWISGEEKTYANAKQSGTLTAAVANENVGNTAKQITFTLPTFKTSGVYANYNFVADTGKKITITKRELTLKMADFKAVTKVYDGNTNATTAVVALTTTGNNKGVKTAAEETSGSNKGVVSGDNVTFTITSDMFKFDKKDASGANRATKLLVADNSKLNAGLDNESAVNYEFKYKADDDTGKSATITKRELTLKMADFKTVTKVYDGNTNATTTVVALTTTGNNKGVKTAAEETSGSGKGVISGDNVTFTITGDMFKFDKKDASGANRATKLLVADNSKLNAGLDSTSKKNYEFKYSNNDDTGKSATITQKALTLNIEDYKVADKVYDNSTAVKVTVGNWKPWGLAGVVGNEDVKIEITDGAFVFATKDANVNKQVNFADVSKLKLIGAQSANYKFDASIANGADSGLKGTITKRELTLKVSDFQIVTKAYDGTTDITTAIVRLKTGNNETGLTAANGNKGVISGDRVKLVIAANMFKFNSKDIASANRLLITTAANLNAGLDGASKDNYEFEYADNANSGISATITQKALTLNTEDYKVADKVYDDSTAAKVTVGDWRPWGLAGVVGNEDVKIEITDGAFVFATKDANVNKQVNFADVSKLKLIGAQSANYKFDASIANGADSGLKGTISQVVSDEAVNIFKNVMKTNPLTGSAVFSARQRAFVPPTPVKSVFTEPSKPVAPTPSAVPSADASPDNAKKPCC